MKAAVSLLVALSAGAAALQAEPRVDNVLIKMVPPGTTSLVGARMDAIKPSELYRDLVAMRKLPQVDAFARESGFDPRRDVRELLWATAPAGSVLLARGAFHVNDAMLRREGAKQFRHGEYVIWGQRQEGGEGSGFCILDSTLAAAGEIPALMAALDEWKSGSHSSAQPLIARLKAVSPQSSIWGVSIGGARFLADNIPQTSAGVDFSKIFRNLEDAWFEAGLSRGLLAEIHGTAGRDEDAATLRNAVRGLVGLGRLSVPNNQPELLKLWDGITVEQSGRTVIIQADIAPDLIDRLVQILGTATQSRPGVPI